ncbi:MAG TPA: hypothetical protein VFN42_08540 [Acetobacteraceae bacterium]|nr:hypothetical protein [Acetobacteraceae bacterium]
MLAMFSFRRRKEPPFKRDRLGPQQLESIFPEFEVTVPMPRSTKIPPKVIVIPAPEEPEDSAAVSSTPRSSSAS